jgi:RNA polymerase sigma factor (sigma-70 family)
VRREVTARVRRAGAAIAVTQLKMALQTTSRTIYDTGHRFQPASPLGRTMDDVPTNPDVRLTDAAAGEPRLDTTLELVLRAKAGDRDALDRLFERSLPALRRWASGRLPRWTRDLMDTDDLVQETVVRAIRRIDSFEPRHEGALQAYLRQAIVNRIRDEVRRTMRSPQAAPLDENEKDREASPLEAAIGGEAVERYEAALARLRPEDREAIVARVEMDYSYEQVAQALGKPSPDAARMAVSRALLRLAEEMSRVA